MKSENKGIINEAKHKDYDLIGAGMVFMVGAMLTALFNYLYHLFMGRMLGPYEYGVLGSLFAIIYVFLFSSSTFTIVTSKYSAKFSENKSYLKRLVSKGFSKVAVGGMFLLFIYIALSWFIADFLNLETTTGVIIVGVIAYVSVLSAIFAGALNGMHKFVWQNVSSIIFVLLKFSLAVLLVYLGFGVNGALIAILIGAVAGLLIAGYPLKKYFSEVKAEKFDSRGIYTYFVIVLFAYLLPIFLITFDQIMVKHLFSSSDAGLYAAAGNVAKIIWFGSGFLTGAVFPKATKLYLSGREPSGILRKGLFYTLILVVIGVGVYFTIPEFIVNLLYGADYVPVAGIIGLFGLALGIYSLTNIMIFYDLAVERYKFLFILAFGFILEVALILMFDTNLLQIVNSVLISISVIFVLMLAYNYKEIFNLK